MKAFHKRIAMLLLFLLPVTAQGAPPVMSFVLAGQSNMVGESFQNTNLKDGRVTSPSPGGISSWSFRQADHIWTLANEFPCDDSQCFGTNCSYPGPNRTVDAHPVWIDQGNGTCVCTCGAHVKASNGGGDTRQGSAWPTFAELWMQMGWQIDFVAAGWGGTSLVANNSYFQPAWDPTAMDCSTLLPYGLGQSIPTLTQPGELYCRMLESVQLANPENLQAVLWFQGENDASAWVSYDSYKAGLKNLADHIWSDLHVPMIVAPISRHTDPTDLCPEWPNIDVIHMATVDATGEHPHLLLGPDSDDLALESDCSHINDVVTLGQRWYYAVAPLVTAIPDSDGDGVADSLDNCKYEPNPTQSDSGGLGAAPPDGIGDACQCGDVNDDGIITSTDAPVLSRALVGLSPYFSVAAMGPGLDKCNVAATPTPGVPGCTASDATVISRALIGLTPGIQQGCDAANP